MAAEYYENGEYEKMPEVMGKLMEIQDLYPDREIFHLAEVTGFTLMAIRYFTAVGQLEAAESRLEVLEKISPDHPDTKQAQQYILMARINAFNKKWEEEEKTKIKVKTSSDIDVAQTSKKPDFTHEEINLLYQHGLHINPDILRKILSLPRETLISDLEKVLHDLMARYNYFESYFEANDWDEETMNFGIHAIFLLGELRAEESLDKFLDVFRQDEEFLDFWFGDFLTEGIWEPLYYIAGNHTERLKQFVIEPAIYTFARTIAYKVMEQIALHQPERKKEVFEWFKYVMKYYAGSGPAENIVDSGAIGSMICDLMRLNATELLAEIEQLFKLDYVSTMMCGDLKSVKKDIARPYPFEVKKDLLNIFDRYEKITTTWAGYNEDDFDEDDPDFDFKDGPDFDFGNIPEPFLPVRNTPKVGRNEPCPCGSGKKYKKCCLNK
jgi:hypothetical protein